jgi:hypothetical protein
MSKKPDSYGQNRLFNHFQLGDDDGPWTTSYSEDEIKSDISPKNSHDVEVIKTLPIVAITELHKSITRWKKSERAHNIVDFRQDQILNGYGGSERVYKNEIDNREEAARKLKIACGRCAYNGLCRFAYKIDAYAGEAGKNYNMHYAKERDRLTHKQLKDSTTRCDYRLADLEIQ